MTSRRFAFVCGVLLGAPLAAPAQSAAPSPAKDIPAARALFSSETRERPQMRKGFKILPESKAKKEEASKIIIPDTVLEGTGQEAIAQLVLIADEKLREKDDSPQAGLGWGFPHDPAKTPGSPFLKRVRLRVVNMRFFDAVDVLCKELDIYWCYGNGLDFLVPENVPAGLHAK